jgi:hypothetical protein
MLPMAQTARPTQALLLDKRTQALLPLAKPMARPMATLGRVRPITRLLLSFSCLQLSLQFRPTRCLTR